MQLADSTDRDLSSWRVSIPAVKTKLDASNKPYSVFYIDVQKVDGMKEGMTNSVYFSLSVLLSIGYLFCIFVLSVMEENEGNHWTVERRYTDFYALEAKLTEFHGEFPDNQLPSRRMLLFSAPNAQFLESRKQVW